MVTVNVKSGFLRKFRGCVFLYTLYKKNATSEFPKKSTLKFLSIKDFRPLGIEIELLIDHITVAVLLNKCINFALCTRVCSNFDSCAILNSQASIKIFCPFKTMSISWEIPRLRFFYTPCIFYSF